MITDIIHIIYSSVLNCAWCSWQYNMTINIDFVPKIEQEGPSLVGEVARYFLGLFLL